MNKIGCNLDAFEILACTWMVLVLVVIALVVAVSVMVTLSLVLRYQWLAGLVNELDLGAIILFPIPDVVFFILSLM